MTWLMLAVGFFLLLSGILSQAYSLKTKRGVLPPKNAFRPRAHRNNLSYRPLVRLRRTLPPKVRIGRLRRTLSPQTLKSHH